MKTTRGREMLASCWERSFRGNQETKFYLCTKKCMRKPTVFMANRRELADSSVNCSRLTLLIINSGLMSIIILLRTTTRVWLWIKDIFFWLEYKRHTSSSMSFINPYFNSLFKDEFDRTMIGP
jgi:hypothetical protein